MEELTPKQQTSEAIRQAESILVTTGQHPSGDQVASVVALALILRKLGKKVTALVSDQVPPQFDYLPLGELSKNLSGLRDFIIKLDLNRAEVDKLKYTIEDGKLNVYVTPFKGGFTPSDVSFGHGDYHYDLIIVLGVPTRGRIDRAAQGTLQSVPIVNIDFHRSNENYGAINLIEGMAASLSEMLVALAESLQQGIIDEQIATALLTGIISSTDRFTAGHTTPKALTVAAQLMAAGAKQQQIVKALFRARSDKKDQPKPVPKKENVVNPPASPVEVPAEPFMYGSAEVTTPAPAAFAPETRSGSTPAPSAFAPEVRQQPAEGSLDESVLADLSDTDEVAYQPDANPNQV